MKYHGLLAGQDIVLMGEVGLAGELRSINQLENRLKEAVKLGFKNAIIPKRNHSIEKINKIKLLKCDSVNDALKQIF